VLDILLRLGSPLQVLLHLVRRFIRAMQRQPEVRLAFRPADRDGEFEAGAILLQERVARRCNAVPQVMRK